MSKSSTIVACLMLLASVGCYYHGHDHDENDPAVYESPGEFTYRADLDRYSATDIYEWDTRRDEAVVTFSADDFYGVIEVRIYDDHDFLVYSRTFQGTGRDEYHVDSTAHGDEGDWRIIVGATEADGYVRLSVR